MPPTPDTRWTVNEALVAILLSAATVDGDMSKLEREDLLTFEHRSRSLRALRPDELSALNKTVVNRLRYEAGTLKSACAALPPDARLPAFAQAIDLMLADGDLNAAESDFVNTLVLYLDLRGEQVENVVEVLVVRNRI